MKYKSEYRHAYTEGTVNKTFSISKVAFDLLNDNIDNQSPFVNDLIIDALQEKDFFKRRLIKQANLLQVDLAAHGYDLEIKERRDA